MNDERIRLIQYRYLAAAARALLVVASGGEAHAQLADGPRTLVTRFLLLLHFVAGYEALVEGDTASLSCRARLASLQGERVSHARRAHRR